MRWPFIFILIVSLCFGISLSVHAEPVAGDSCAGYPEGAQMYSGGPGMGGHAFQITCQSGVWAILQVNPGSGGGGQDDSPDLFTFASLNDQPLSTQVFSNSVTITGIGPDPVNVTVSGDGGPTMRINGTGGWVTSGTIANNQTLELRMTSSASFNTQNSAKIVVGSRTRYWNVRTVQLDQTPDDINFGAELSAPLSALTTSSAIIISGINTAVTVSVTGDGSPRISINGGTWTTSGTITNGQTLAVRLTSSSDYFVTHTASITVGDVVAEWIVRTIPQPPSAGLWVWGQHDQWGTTGLGLTEGETPVPVKIGSATDWSAVSTAVYHSCGIQGGKLYCWGFNSGGRTGLGTTSGNQLTPAQVGTLTDWSVVSNEFNHSCGIRSGRLYCWGPNSYGATGLGTTSGNQTTPAQVGSFTDWTAVSVQFNHTCGIRSGRLYCWGYNAEGRTGLGTTSGNQTTPAQVGSFTDWTSVSGGRYHSCGVRAGRLYCWGENDDGKTALGTESGNQTSPAQVGSFTDWTMVSSGDGHACGLRAGRLYCWGENVFGSLGLGNNNTNQLSPIQVGTVTDWDKVYAAGYNGCAIRSGELYCWGGGLTGNGDTSNVKEPTRIGTGNQWKSVAISRWGGHHTLGVYGP